MKQRAYAYLVSVVALGLMLEPAFREPREDGFPFSTYPMFARERSRSEAVTSAILVSKDGSELSVPSGYVVSSEPMLAIATLRKTVSQGQKASLGLCRAIAKRVVESGDEALTKAMRVEIVTRSVDAIEYLNGRAKPGGGRVHARCGLRPKAPR